MAVENLEVPSNADIDVLEVTQGIIPIPGPPGEKGDKGYQGEPGPSAYDVAVADGFSGTVDDWLASLKGEQGARGAQGNPGRDGQDGARGPTGATGAPGATGAQGPKGDRGDTGATGPAGTPGESAYALAVDQGYLGTLAQWLASLQGPPGLEGETGAKGDTGTVGATGAKGDAGDTGPAGPGVAAGGNQGFILSKSSSSDFDTAWVDVNSLVDWDRISTMIATAIASGAGTNPSDPGNGGTDPGDGGDTGDLLVTRWTMNGISSPITPSGSLSTAMSIATNDDGTAPIANGSALLLNKGSYLAADPLVFNLAATGDDATTQTPSVFRVGIKGIIGPSYDTVVDVSKWNVGQFTFASHWNGTALRVTMGRNGNGVLYDSDDGNIDFGKSHLYEAEWTNDLNGSGGTVRFYIDGVQLGSDKSTSNKLRLSDEMELDVNATLGNTSGSVDDLTVEYIEIGYQG